MARRRDQTKIPTHSSSTSLPVANGVHDAQILIQVIACICSGITILNIVL